jgi:23S rRNA pseudouridine2605 synthase
MRLAKHLAHSGVASRRACEALIAQGRVSVDGQVARDPAREVGQENEIVVDGRRVDGFEAPVVYALNKPTGVLSTASDPHRRPTVVQLLGDRRRLYPVGRLDLDSEGLILLTNDGQLAHTLTHPRFEVPKTYEAWVHGAVSEDQLRALREGPLLEDGPTAPTEVQALGPSRLRITIKEGRNRQVRRMCDAIGHPVQRLRRVRFGSLDLAGLPLGGHRLLDAAETQALRDAARGRLTAPGAL